MRIGMDESEMIIVRRAEAYALRQEIRRLETMLDGAVEAGKAVTRERDELRLFVAAHTRLERGITDFDLQNEVVEAFRVTTELPAVRAVIVATLEERNG
jgi:hypothetical protein